MYKYNVTFSRFTNSAFKIENHENKDLFCSNPIRRHFKDDIISRYHLDNFISNLAFQKLLFQVVMRIKLKKKICYLIAVLHLF